MAITIRKLLWRSAGGFLVVGLLALVASTCSEANLNSPNANSDTNNNNPESTNNEPGTGHIDFYLTDEPANYDQVNVDVQGLRIQYTPASQDTADADTMDNGKWIDLPVDPIHINLLELQGEVDSLLASADLEPGFYRELRLMLGDSNNVVINSVSHNLKVPSGRESGYKIKFSTELEAGEDLDITIDFDAAKSVHKAGKSGKHILKPVLKAFVREGDGGETAG